MIELNSVVVILMAEALVALLLLVVGLWLWSRKKQSGDYLVARTLIDTLDEGKAIRTENLGALIVENGVVDPELQPLLKAIDVREKALYRQIIELFLNRDAELLKAVDESIQDLAQPYCALLKHAGSNVSVVEDSGSGGELAAAKQAITRLTDENAVLAEQLRLALKTVDESSEEHAGTVSGNKNMLELRVTPKRSPRIFQSIKVDAKR